MRRLLPPTAAALVLAALAPACGGGSGGDLTVYSGRTQNLIEPLLERFADEHDVDIVVKYDDSANLATLIDTEGDASPADVFLSQSPGAIGFLDAQGRLGELPDDPLARVPERFRASDGDWVGISGRVRTLAYNTDAVDPSELPDSVLDLTGERYSGRVGLAPTNGSFQDFVTTMRALLGDDDTLSWLEAMRENDVRTYENNTAILEAVARGEIDFGLVNHYYVEQAKSEDSEAPVANHFFPGGDAGSMVLTTAVGVLDTAGDRRADAEALVAYLLSKEAQDYFAQETLEYPLVEGVDPAVDLPPLADIAAPVVELDDLGGGLSRTREMIRESGLESA